MDDGRQLLHGAEPIFASVPEPPAEWHDLRQPVGFGLPPVEARFLRGCFLAVHCPSAEGLPSLLSRLVGTPLRASTGLWDGVVFAAADPNDRLALRRAEQVAALAAVGRAVYAALVESMRERADGVATEDLHRQHLREVLGQYGDSAVLV